MGNRITVFTTDRYLFQKIKLALRGTAEVSLGGTDPQGIVLFDLDTVFSLPPEGALTMSRRQACDIPLPPSLSRIRALVGEEGAQAIEVFEKERAVLLRGERIKLTEVEFSLFSLLHSRCGEFITREEILDTVWGADADAGVINVYIHYLREKLEKHGEKIIISSRKCGYKIDGKYEEVKNAQDH